MILERSIKPTLTPLGLNHGDTLRLTLTTGRIWEMTLLRTGAKVLARNAKAHDSGHVAGDISAYAFNCELRVNGRDVQLSREVATEASFYEPICLDGVNVWFDAAACAFQDKGGFMAEKDWRLGFICQPMQAARFAVQEASLRICPDPLQLWYPNTTGRLEIGDCYNGEDCWMGPYNGGSAHCGLDINMPAGTLLTAPLTFDDHCLFHATASGFSNNRWRGVRHWPDGSEWQLQALHLIGMLVPERGPLAAGTPYATTAGTAIGSHEHTHFMFRVIEQHGEYLLDPWILFWQMFADAKSALSR